MSSPRPQAAAAPARLMEKSPVELRPAGQELRLERVESRRQQRPLSDAGRGRPQRRSDPEAQAAVGLRLRRRRLGVLATHRDRRSRLRRQRRLCRARHARRLRLPQLDVPGERAGARRHRGGTDERQARAPVRRHDRMVLRRAGRDRCAPLEGAHRRARFRPVSPPPRLRTRAWSTSRSRRGKKRGRATRHIRAARSEEASSHFGSATAASYGRPIWSVRPKEIGRTATGFPRSARRVSACGRRPPWMPGVVASTWPPLATTQSRPRNWATRWWRWTFSLAASSGRSSSRRVTCSAAPARRAGRVVRTGQDPISTLARRSISDDAGGRPLSPAGRTKVGDRSCARSRQGGRRPLADARGQGRNERRLMEASPAAVGFTLLSPVNSSDPESQGHLVPTQTGKGRATAL